MIQRERMYHLLIQRWYLALCAGYVLFVYYVTLVPFRFSRDPAYIIRKFHKFELIPYFLKAHHYSGADVVVNIILFIPAGILFYYALGRLTTASVVKRGVLAVLGGVVLSTSVELLQVLTYDRSPTVSDIINNGLGTLVGVVLAYGGSRLQWVSARYWRRDLAAIPEILIATGLLGLTAFVYLAPFDFKINVRAVVRTTLRFFRDPLQLQGFWLSELLVLFVLYLVLYYFLTTIQELRKRPSERLWRVLLFFFPIALEALQVGVPFLRLSVLDVLVAWSALAVVRHYFQNHSVSLEFNQRFHQHNRFLKQVSLVYGAFLVVHLFVLPALAFNVRSVPANWSFFVDPLAWILRKDRIQSVVWLMQWSIIFVPFGFFIQGYFPKWAGKLPLLTLVVVGASIPILLGVPAFQVHWTQAISALIGSSLGREMWFFYQFLFSGWSSLPIFQSAVETQNTAPVTVKVQQ